MTQKDKPKIIIPRIFGGISIDRAYEDVMNSKAVAPEPAPITRKTGKVDGMIHVPEINLYFARGRTHLGKTWNETHQLLAAENLRMPTVEEFRRVLKYFKDSQDNELQTIYNDITEVRDPWRANWLDAYFEKRGKEWNILTGNKAKAEKLETCLRKDKTPGIDISSWLTDATSQGLPKADISNGDLYYWHPRENAVARFFAGSGGAGLDCDWGPEGGFPFSGYMLLPKLEARLAKVS